MFTLKEFFSQNYSKHLKFFISLLLFLLHLYFILRYYRKYEKFDESTSELQWPMELPDVTVCSNLIVSPEVSGTKSIYLKKNEMEFIRILSFAKTVNLTATSSGIVENCEFTDFQVPCKKQRHFNYFHGDCETISMGDKPNSDIPVTGFRFEGTVDKMLVYQFLRQPSFVMVFHAPETPPIFFKEKLIFGNYDGNYVIHLKKKISNRVDCFTEENVRNREFPGTKNGNKYSYEACLASCYQNFTMSQCGCILPQLYFAENSNRFPVCRMCRGDFTVDLSHLCHCKPLCKDVEWEWSVEDVKFKNESEPVFFYRRPPPFSSQNDADRKDYNFRMSLKSDQKHIDVLRKRMEWDFAGPPGIFKVKVEYHTAEVTVIHETLLMKNVELIGTIGGSFCLFFGANPFRVLQLMVLEIFHFYTEAKRKLDMLNRSKRCLNMRRALAVLSPLLWVLITIALTTLFGIMSMDLIKDYLKFSMIQHPSINWNRNFPAITVCSAVPLLWHEVRLQPLLVMIENRAQGVPVFRNKNMNQSDFIRGVVQEMRRYKDKLIENKENVYLEETDYHDKILRKFQTGSRKEREKCGIKIEDYIKKCTWSNSGLSHNCSETEFVQFNNHKYGNCATINHGSLTNEDNTGPIDELEMILNWNHHPIPIQKDIAGAPGLIVHLHERGTAPLFTPSTTHLIRAFTNNHITFTSEMHRFSSTNCLDGKDAAMREKSVYQDENRQYLHTINSCLESCIQNVTREEARCNSCYQPLMLGEYKVDEENICTTFCPWMEQELLINKCDCKESCDSMQYKTEISASNFIKNEENSYIITDKRDNPAYVSMRLAQWPTTMFNRKIFPEGSCGFKVSAQNNIQNVFYETPKFKLVKLLGLIGGIMGFLQLLLSIFRSLRIFFTKSP